MEAHSRAVRSRQVDGLKLPKALLRALKTPLSAHILAAMEEGAYQSVVDASIDVSLYSDADVFARDYLAVSLLRKYSAFPLGIDTARVALDKWLTVEDTCRRLNRTRLLSEVAHGCGITPETYISYARKRIARLLGAFDWNQAWEHFGFSGGASTRLKKSVGAPFYKFQGKPETTRNAALLSICAIWSIPLWRAEMESRYGLDPCNWVTIVDGSRVSTVPKSAKTDRVICIEPEMNMFIQRGIGAVIRRKLRSVGIDLNDQTRNQYLALVGSRTGSLTTIDLASASDSVTLELVRLLLPPDWFDALCRCRSEVAILPCGKKHPLEKISSMGNGYTFELESLIFWALAQAVIEVHGCEDRRVGVYGDDIVIHNSVADELISVLAYCGFETNRDKTFLSGPFRESCGKHYFYGTDVTPFYCKDPLDGLHRKYWFANSLRLWASMRSKPCAYQGVYDYAVRAIPPKRRFVVPATYGTDAGLWGSFDEATPSIQRGPSRWPSLTYCDGRTKCRGHTSGLKVVVYRTRRKKHRPNGYAAVLHWFNAAGPSQLYLEKGEDMYFTSIEYISWWDAAPSGVVLRGQRRV